MENKLFSLLFHRFTQRSIDTARPCETTPEIIGGPMENTRFSLVFHRFTEINKYNRWLVKDRNPSGLTGFVWRGFTVGILINRYLPAGQDRSLQGLQLSRPLLFLIRYVCSLVFSLGSTLVILFYSCHLLILLSSLEKWPSATSFLIRYVCSLVFRSGSFLRMARDWHLPKKLQRCSMAWIQWFLALRLQAPEFSILSVARRTYFFLTQNYQLMISGYEASRARLLYSEQGSQDIYFPYTRSI